MLLRLLLLRLGLTSGVLRGLHASVSTLSARGSLSTGGLLIGVRRVIHLLIVDSTGRGHGVAGVLLRLRTEQGALRRLTAGSHTVGRRGGCSTGRGLSISSSGRLQTKHRGAENRTRGRYGDRRLMSHGCDPGFCSGVVMRRTTPIVIRRTITK